MKIDLNKINRKDIESLLLEKEMNIASAQGLFDYCFYTRDNPLNKNDILDYFKLHKSELIVDINDIGNECEKKEKEKKYYDILSCPNPLIENIPEYIEFMKNHGLNNEEIIDILYSTIHDNMINYELKSNWWERIWKKNY